MTKINNDISSAFYRVDFPRNMSTNLNIILLYTYFEEVGISISSNLSINIYHILNKTKLS